MEWEKGLEELGYTVLNAIGRGSAATVRKVVYRGRVLAAKIIDLRYLRLRDNFDISKLRREVDIMQSLNHPSIVKFERVLEFLPDTLVVVMEHLQGKELFDLIVASNGSGGLPEREARSVMKQLLSAVAHLHR
jgi:serine/threonine protein kinase